MDDNRNSAVLEGMYKGVSGKIDEVRESVSRELQYSSTQQAYAYESLTADYKRGVETVLAELRYLSQQNSSIYDNDKRERLDLKEAVLSALHDEAAQLAGQIVGEMNARFEALAQSLKQDIDYDLLAEKVAACLEANAPVATEPEKVAEPEETVPAEEGTPLQEADFDYELLAEKIATILPETDYDLLADKVAAAVPATDADAIADKVALAVPQVDDHAIAERVSEVITPTDYDLVAERVAAVFEGETTVKLNDETVEKIARRVAELLQGEKVAEETEIAAASAPAPAPAPVEPAPAKTVIAPVVVVPAPAAAEKSDGVEMTTRYKRSFVAKIIESDEEIKRYYSDLKNVILSYGKVRSQINWTNDRFSLDQESIIKIGVRGKTLVAYFALDPNEFPETVYHQTFAGDTKMYEKTPMMVKIRSNVAVKRATKLVELLMERNGAVKEEREPVDYAAQYFFRTEEELLAEGLIKTAVVEKSDLNF